MLLFALFAVIQLHMDYRKMVYSIAGGTARIFIQRHPENYIDNKYICELVQNFETTGPVVNMKKRVNRIVDGGDRSNCKF